VEASEGKDPPPLLWAPSCEAPGISLYLVEDFLRRLMKKARSAPKIAIPTTPPITPPTITPVAGEFLRGASVPVLLGFVAEEVAEKDVALCSGSSFAASASVRLKRLVPSTSW